MFHDDDLIHRYTRKQAIEDAVLVDVTPTAREAGFRLPVALTRAVWEHYVRVPGASKGRTNPAGCGTSSICSATPSSDHRTATPSCSSSTSETTTRRHGP